MSTRRERLSYSWTTGAIASLVAVGVGVYFTRGLVPPPEANRLAGEPGEFLVRGVNQSIDWYPVGNEAFREARRLNKPIFMLIGNAWSRAGRLSDVSAFQTKEVRERLRQEFISIRIDATENPEWANAYLPLSRATAGFDFSQQVHILDPSGKLITSILRRTPAERVDGTAVLEAMRKTREILDDVRDDDPMQAPPGAVQRDEVQALVNPARRPEADIQGFYDFVRRQIDPQHGGVPVGGFQTLPVGAWRFLLAIGDIESLRSSLEPALLSPIVDWVDGGFFRQTTTLNWRGVETDKLATQNAAMAALLARYACATNSEFAEYLATRTFDSLMDNFVQDGLFMTARLGDEKMLERSQRLSVSVKSMRAAFSPPDREWLRNRLGLRVESNPQMLPFVTSTDVVTRERSRLEKFLGQLNEIEADVPNYYVGKRLLDTNGYVVARLIETARLLNSPERLRRALLSFDNLSRFRVGDNDVVHDVNFGGRDHRVLADYLAYADACQQAYLATGSGQIAQDGFKVLQRALFLFSGAQSGMLYCGLFDEFDPLIPDVKVPNIVDGAIESTSAWAIRLCYQYGCMFRNLDTSQPLAQEGERVYQTARSAVGLYASAANELKNGFGGYYHAALLAEDDFYAVTVGPDRFRLADELLRKVPHRFIIPSSKVVRPILNRRPAGIYLLRGNAADGPYTLDQAAIILSRPCIPIR